MKQTRKRKVSLLPVLPSVAAFKGWVGWGFPSISTFSNTQHELVAATIYLQLLFFFSILELLKYFSEEYLFFSAEVEVDTFISV